MARTVSGLGRSLIYETFPVAPPKVTHLCAADFSMPGNEEPKVVVDC